MHMHNQGSKYGGRQQQKPEFFDTEVKHNYKKKYVCKKSKGLHVWEHISSVDLRFFKNNIWREYRCIVCGKHGHEMGTYVNKKFDYARKSDIMVITQ